jgi:ribosomal protein L37E
MRPTRSPSILGRMGCVAESAICNHCGKSVDPSRDEPCSHCGRYAGKKIKATVADGIGVGWSVSWTRTREFWEINWPWLILVVVISVASPFLGLLIAGILGVLLGLVIGAAEFVVGLYAIGKIRDITHGGDQ